MSDVGDIAKSIRSVAGSSSPRATLQPKAPVGAKPPAIGKGTPGAASSGSGGGELQETSVADREYWSDRTITSTDGVFTWVVKPIKRVKLTSGRSIRFAEPSA